jgi:predicted SnoaL-like aldol condensation-catalyzing enzyme
MKWSATGAWSHSTWLRTRISAPLVVLVTRVGKKDAPAIPDAAPSPPAGDSQATGPTSPAGAEGSGMNLKAKALTGALALAVVGGAAYSNLDPTTPQAAAATAPVTAVAAATGVRVQPTAEAPAASPPQSPSQAQAAQEEQNKALVLRVYNEAFGQGNTEVVQELFTADTVQHNTTVANGPEGQITLIEALKAKIPGLVATVKHISADGDLVAVHWHASATPENEMSGQAVVDLFRLANGKIVEHWDVYQDVPAQTASGNSLFSDLYQYAQGRPTLSEEQEEANKQLVVMAYSGLFNEGKIELLDQYWDPVYFQHNPRVPNGTAGLKQLLQSMPAGGGGPTLTFSQVVSDQDLVWTFSQVSMPGSGSTGGLGVDIFRVVDGKIVEHWDVVPALPAN